MKLVVQLHFNLRDFLGFNLVNYWGTRFSLALSLAELKSLAFILEFWNQIQVLYQWYGSPKTLENTKMMGEFLGRD